MDVWEWVVAAILGLVEGLTEYAPVSSTGHMIIVDDLWLKSSELVGSQNAYVFKIVIQLGSILAVALLFKDRLLQLAGFKKQAATQSEGRGLTLGKVAVGLLPAAVLGLLFEDKMESIFHVRTVAFALIAGAFLMIAADFINKRNDKKKQQTASRRHFLQTSTGNWAIPMPCPLARLFPFRLNDIRRRHAWLNTPSFSKLHLYYGDPNYGWR